MMTTQIQTILQPELLPNSQTIHTNIFFHLGDTSISAGDLYIPENEIQIDRPEYYRH